MTQFRQEQKQAESSCIKGSRPLANRFNVLQLALLPDDRAILHQRIEKRFIAMMEHGFIDEVKALRARGDLHLDLPSMRSVGYRQVWMYLDVEDQQAVHADPNVSDKAYQEMIDKGVAATRQLAKRQLTWLRNWSDLHVISVESCMNERTLQKNVDLILNFLPSESI